LQKASKGLFVHVCEQKE